MKIFLIAVMGAFGFLVVILAIYAGGNWLLSRLKKPKPPSSISRYRERLLNPRWEELENHFGQSIPEQIKKLYARTEFISRRDIQLTNENGKPYEIAEFLPADIETLDRIWSDLKKAKNFPFARDSMDDCYYVPLTGGKSEDCPVMCYHHDGSDFESVSRSLDDFAGRNAG
jgi:cell division septal protein FtsQ